MSIQKLLIANRGEIAVRIIRAAGKLNIPTVQVYSEGDTEMAAVKMAEDSVCIGPAKSSESYLNIEAIVKAARDKGCDAVHPGYGFLSENSGFVRALETEGIRFVGPSAEVIERMGDKVAARNAAREAGVPVVPGSPGRIDDLEEAAKIAREIGFPIMVKAAAGGGGRGIRVAHDEDELRKLASQAAAEAKAAFGDGGLYLERDIIDPRHIEVQILGDGKNAIHLYERECSVQRRRQKVWEESGALCLSENVRNQICESSVELARSVGYRGAGTLEYLYDQTREEFYFIEMNTRIQVEHPVTEMITGVDLVAEMLRIAGGEPLTMRQSDIRREGHSIEVRVNAEDPYMQFMPFPGKVGKLQIPQGPGIRFDHFLSEGYQIPPFYDSLLGKLIVHAENRPDAIQKLKSAIDELKIEGVKTTLPLFSALAEDADILSGNFHTQWLEAWLEAGNLSKQENL